MADDQDDDQGGDTLKDKITGKSAKAKVQPKNTTATEKAMEIAKMQRQNQAVRDESQQPNKRFFCIEL